MEKLFIEDIMSQHFEMGTFVNPTRLIMLGGMIQQGKLKKIYNRRDILEYVYRVYIDNSDIASRNPYVSIRHIGKYGLRDTEEVLEDALSTWSYEAKNGLLLYDSKHIYLNIEDEIDSRKMYSVMKVLYKKYFHSEILLPGDTKEILLMDDLDTETFGQSVYFRRVLEDIQYCPLCEEVKIENLRAVHIIKDSSKMTSDTEKQDKCNGLILCVEHANAYNNELFSFNETGFVTNIRTNCVQPGMRLSFDIRSGERGKYIKKLNMMKTE